MQELPDLIGMELEEGLDYLEKNGIVYQLVENYFPGKEYSPKLKRRIVRIRRLDSGGIEVTYSADTYSSSPKDYYMQPQNKVFDE